MSLSLLGLSFGGSVSKSSQTTNGSSTTTKSLPDWLGASAQTVAGLGGALAGQDPFSFVAPADPLQMQAAAGAAGLSDYAEGYGAAADLIRGAGEAGRGDYQAATYDPRAYEATSYGGATVGPVANAAPASLLDNLDAYMSPYRRNVVDAALADFDYGAGRTRAQQDLDLARAGAFGGSGAALTRSMTEENLIRGRAGTSANLLDQMFNRGAALANLDADRRNQTAMGNAASANNALLTQAQLAQQAGLARSQAFNDAAQFGAQSRNAALQFNADAFNEAARFNAGQADAAMTRRLEAGRALIEAYNSRGANLRSNIETQAGLGAVFRGLEQDRRRAPLEHASQVAAILGGLPFSSFGQETTTSTQTVKGRNKSANAQFSFGKS